MSPFPQDVHVQLWGAIGAVFTFWMSARAITYRRMHDIPEDWGTAVNIQSMVFGNLGETSATAVALTRNPTTGEKKIQGEFLLNAQGEEVIAGNRAPRHLTRDARLDDAADELSMEEDMPALYAQFRSICELLEQHYRDMLELEFTVEGGRLWMLQTRRGKRTSKAAMRIAVDLANEGLISRDEAVARIDPLSLDELLHPTISEKAKRTIVAKGLAASPGAAAGIWSLSRRMPKPMPLRAGMSFWRGSRRALKMCMACMWPRASSPLGRFDKPRRRCCPRHGHPVRDGCANDPHRLWQRGHDGGGRGAAKG